jgi:hypothetical protein
MLLPFFLIACDKTQEMVEDAKKIHEKVVGITVDTAEMVVNETDNALQTASQEIENAVNEAIERAINEIKLWIINSLKPVLPWLFIICFLMLFALLKAIIPFGTTVVVQIPLVVLSYSFSLSLFMDLGLTHFALIATLWLLGLIMLFGLLMYFYWKKVIPMLRRSNNIIVKKLSNIDNVS